MKLDKIANSSNDEFYTPKYAVVPILKYLKLYPNIKKVWCPFDTAQSWFVKLLIDEGYEVIYTHINENKDFFKVKVPECDCIVSNPPYSIKTEILEYLFSLNKPFAMLLGVVGLFESEKRFTMFKENKFEVLYLNRRVAYFKDYLEQKPSLNPPFSSAYICSNLLPNQICFERINKS